MLEQHHDWLNGYNFLPTNIHSEQSFLAMNNFQVTNSFIQPDILGYFNFLGRPLIIIYIILLLGLIFLFLCNTRKGLAKSWTLIEYILQNTHIVWPESLLTRTFMHLATFFAVAIIGNSLILDLVVSGNNLPVNEANDLLEPAHNNMTIYWSKLVKLDRPGKFFLLQDCTGPGKSH